MNGGQRNEEPPVKHFEKVSGCFCTTVKCGFFEHPEDCKYGASPDAICPGSILLEIKTRAENCSSSLEKLNGERLSGDPKSTPV